MQITLPPHIQSYIRQQIEAGRHETEQEVIVDVFEQVMHEYDPFRDPIFLESLAQAERGEVRPLTEELMHELSARARENARLGKPIRDDVKY